VPLFFSPELRRAKKPQDQKIPKQPSEEMSFEDVKRDNMEGVKAGLKALGQLLGNGAPFALDCHPSDVALEKRVAEYNTDMYDHGTLYQTILENVNKLHENLSLLDASVLAKVGQACSKRVLRFVIEDNGGTCAAKCMFRDGRLDLVFHAQVRTDDFVFCFCLLTTPSAGAQDQPPLLGRGG
jgi:hypothetical protein